MRRMTGTLLAAAMLGLSACDAGGETAEVQTPVVAAPTSGAVVLRDQPDIGQGVSALPRLVGDGAAIQAINADLERLDDAARAGGCDTPGGGGYERGSTQPMMGPGYVSFWIMENYACEGAAHPSVGQTAITYDLATGQRVDWVAAAPGLGLTRGDTTDMPVDYVPILSSPALSAWYSARMLALDDAEHTSECRDVWTTDALAGTGFKVWLDAENGGLSASPEFAHVIQACADSATMTAEEMRGFGVSQAIIDAVTAAHAAGNWAPKNTAQAQAS